MNYGLQVFSDYGSTQINQDYNNLFLVNKVNTGYLNAAPDNASKSSTILNNGYTYTTNNPNNILGFYCESEFVVDVDGNGVYTIAPLTGGYVIIYEFGILMTPKNNYGLVVYKADGTIAFDSSSKPMRVVAAQEGNVRTTNLSVSTPSGKTYAIVVGNATKKYHYAVTTMWIDAPYNEGTKQYPGYTSIFSYWSTTKYRASSIVEVKGLFIDEIITKKGGYSENDMVPANTIILPNTAFVIDVTNY